jgi:ABC-2 type transport system permease protein
MWDRILGIIRKEFRQTLREPRTRGMLFMPPIIQLLIFGYAVNMDVEHARIAWMDQDQTPESRELKSRFEGSDRFSIVSTPRSDREMEELFDNSRVDAAIRVNPGFGSDLSRGRQANVQILVDGTNSNTASIVAGYLGRTAAGFGGEALQAQQKEKLVGRTTAAGTPLYAAIPTVHADTRVWFNPDLRSRNYFVPGVIVNIITLVTLSLTAMAIVREKEIGTMEQLLVTPLRPVELIIGKTLPFALIGLFDTLLVVGAALLLFRVPFRGSILFLLACAILFCLTTLGSGLFISTVSRTQQQAMMSTFLFFMPFFMLSGFSFPVRNMPQIVQYITYLNPVRYFIDIVRGVFLKGVGIEVLWPQMLALTVIGLVILSLSVLRFRSTLE